MICKKSLKENKTEKEDDKFAVNKLGKLRKEIPLSSQSKYRTIVFFKSIKLCVCVCVCVGIPLSRQISDHANARKTTRRIFADIKHKFRYFYFFRFQNLFDFLLKFSVARTPPFVFTIKVIP